LLALASPAHAGKHYFMWQRPPDEKSLQPCLAEMQQLVAAADAVLAGPSGEGQPLIKPHRLQFNGRADAARDPFTFPGPPGLNTCKTDYKPYDKVVTACLLVARDHFPPGILMIGSDADWEDDDWSEGARLYQEVLGREPHNPLPRAAVWDEIDVPGSNRFLARLIFVAIAVVVAWLLVGPHHIFVIRIENGIARTRRGKVSASFLWALNTTCEREGLIKGVIRGVQFRHGILLRFSRGIPPQCRQGIRNLWALHG
jgi:hypothetical protein